MFLPKKGTKSRYLSTLNRCRRFYDPNMLCKNSDQPTYAENQSCRANQKAKTNHILSLGSAYEIVSDYIVLKKINIKSKQEN